MKYQLIVTFEIPDGAPLDALNEMEGDVEELVQRSYGTWYPEIQTRKA